MQSWRIDGEPGLVLHAHAAAPEPTSEAPGQLVLDTVIRDEFPTDSRDGGTHFVAAVVEALGPWRAAPSAMIEQPFVCGLHPTGVLLSGTPCDDDHCAAVRSTPQLARGSPSTGANGSAMGAVVPSLCLRIAMMRSEPT